MKHIAAPQFTSLRLVFSRLAIKPGKPAWLGKVGGAFIVGLPGNPTSTMVTGRLLLVPLLSLIQGRQSQAALEWKSQVLASALPPFGARETFYRAVFRQDAVEILSSQDSGTQKALAEADVLVRQRANTPRLRRATWSPLSPSR